MVFLPIEDIDALRKELSEVFWDQVYRDKLGLGWMDVFRLMEMRHRDQIPVILINRREVSLTSEMYGAFEETELAIDKMYFAMLKYPKLLPKEA